MAIQMSYDDVVKAAKRHKRIMMMEAAKNMAKNIWYGTEKAFYRGTGTVIKKLQDITGITKIRETNEKLKKHADELKEAIKTYK